MHGPLNVKYDPPSTNRNTSLTIWRLHTFESRSLFRVLAVHWTNCLLSHKGMLKYDLCNNNVGPLGSKTIRFSKRTDTWAKGQRPHTHTFSLLARQTDRQTGSTAARRTMVFPVGCVISFTESSPYQRCLDSNVTYVELFNSIGLWRLPMMLEAPIFLWTVSIVSSN